MTVEQFWDWALARYGSAESQRYCGCKMGWARDPRGVVRRLVGALWALAGDDVERMQQPPLGG